MKRSYLRCILALPLLGGRVRAEAPPPPAELSLRAALNAAMSGNPLLLSGGDRVAVAEGLRTQASLKPNPRVVFQSENGRAWESPGINFWRDTDSYVYGAQVVERGRKRERREDYATAGVDRARSERDALEAQVRARVAAAYWAAAAASRIVELYRQDLATFERIVQFNRTA